MIKQNRSIPFEMKSLDANGVIMGYASVFDTIDAQREQVQKGAFIRSLNEWRNKGRTPAMLWMHNAAKPIGIWDHLYEDSKGLVVQGRMALTTQGGREAYELLKMKALTGLSIGYRTVTSALDVTAKIRILKDVELFEVSLVTFPANEQARITLLKNQKPKSTENSEDARGELRALAAKLKSTARLYQS